MRKKQQWEHYTTGVYVRGYTPFNAHDHAGRRWVAVALLGACLVLMLLLFDQLVLPFATVGAWLVSQFGRVSA